MKFEGIYTPAITPHREDGSIDRDAFAAHLEYLIASGVHGIINGGSTGEYYAQSMQERLEMATLARDVTKGRTHLMVGTVAIRLEDSITMAEHAAKIGADSVLVGSPPYSVPTERENALNALAIEDQHRGYLCFDLLTGRVNKSHPLFPWLLRNGATLDEPSVDAQHSF